MELPVKRKEMSIRSRETSVREERGDICKGGGEISIYYGVSGEMSVREDK